MAKWPGTIHPDRARSVVARFFAQVLVAVSATVLFPLSVFAQTVSAPAPQSPPDHFPPVKPRSLINHFPEGPSLPPAVTIPIDALSFSVPSTGYLGSRNTFVSLDFLDENRLLFTFRIPGLLHRDPTIGGESTERQIRAVVLALPQGTIEAEASWTVHDRSRYLWALKDGHFLLRDRNNLFNGDATLALRPFLDFPGPLLSLELDPTQQLLVTNSREPAAKSANSGQVPSPPTASAEVTSDHDATSGESDRPDYVVRIFRRQSGQVMLVSRVRGIVHIPINSVGYLETLRGQGTNWVLSLKYFSGGSVIAGNVDSSCEPDVDFLSEKEFLVTACGSDAATKLVAMTTSGRTLWIAQAPSTEVWPHLSVASGGLRLAWQTLDVNHSVNSYEPLDAEDIKEQSVTVFDAATGDIALVSPVSPILDAGGNVAISPSGRRVALLNAGAIQIFDLPAPPPLPAANGASSP